MLILNEHVRTVLQDLLVEYQILDFQSSVIITFSPAGYLLKDKEVQQGKPAWGFSFFKKLGVNVISFSAVNQKHWFTDNETKNFIKQLVPQLTLFPERLGYGASMGAFANSIYASQLNLDRLLLITPMAPPFQGSEHFTVDFCNQFTGTVTLIYDPFCKEDKSCALQYPLHTNYVMFYGVGHQVIESLSEIGYLKKLVLDFINNSINKNEFYRESRKRRSIERYYSYLKRNPTRKNTSKRKKVILLCFLRWNLLNPTAFIKKFLRKAHKSLKKKF